MTWVIVTALLILFIFWGKGLSKKIAAAESDFQTILNEKGIDQTTKVQLGTYVGGHPDLDNVVPHVFSYKHQNCLTLYAKLYRKSGDAQTLYFEHIADIPIDKIKDIIIEDTSSVEKKITLGRVLLVGVFALAWKKKTKTNEAFLNIVWADGKYNHESLFQFKDQGAFQEANRTRNILIKQTR